MNSVAVWGILPDLALGGGDGLGDRLDDLRLPAAVFANGLDHRGFGGNGLAELASQGLQIGDLLVNLVSELEQPGQLADSPLNFRLKGCRGHVGPMRDGAWCLLVKRWRYHTEGLGRPRKTAKMFFKCSPFDCCSKKAFRENAEGFPLARPLVMIDNL